MTDQQQSRRKVMKAAGGATLVAGAAIMGTPAARAAASHNQARALAGLPIPDRVTAYQDNWRFCNYCFSLWWNGAPTNGACASRNSPDGQHHGPGSWNFFLPANPAEHI